MSLKSLIKFKSDNEQDNQYQIYNDDDKQNTQNYQNIKFNQNTYSKTYNIKSNKLNNENIIKKHNYSIDNEYNESNIIQQNQQGQLDNHNNIVHFPIKLHPLNSIINKNNNKIQQYPLILQRLTQLQQKMNNHHIQQLRKQQQNKLQLQKRLTNKSQRSQTDKAINLTKLLIIQIQQIKSRVLNNQKKYQINQQKNNQIQSKFNQMQQQISNFKNQSISQNKNKKQYQNKYQQLQDIINNRIISIEQLYENKLNQLKQNQLSLQLQLKKQLDTFTQNIKQIQTKQIQRKNNLLNLQQKHKISSIQMNQQHKKNHKKFKKQIQTNLNNVLQQFKTQFITKKQFLSNCKQIQTHLNRLNDNIVKISNQNITKNDQIDKKVNLLDNALQIHKNNINNLINKLQRQLSQKLSQQQFKFFSQQFNKLIKKYIKTQQMHKYLQIQNQKVYKIINSNFDQQKLVNQTLCSENILGRWLWQGQKLKGGNLISWDKQVINTLPQNFKYSQTTNNIIQIVNSGIYKFQLGFYAKKKPIIEIIINGKVVMSAVNSSSYVLHHSSGKLKGIQPTEISGLTLVDFFLVPENSRIAIAYQGELKGEGFINIHRL